MHLAEGILPLAQAAAFSAAGAGAPGDASEKQASINEAMPSVVMAGITSLSLLHTLAVTCACCRGHKPHLLDPSIRSHSRRKAYSLADVFASAKLFSHRHYHSLVNTIPWAIGPGMTVGLYALASRVGLGNAFLKRLRCWRPDCLRNGCHAMAVVLVDMMAPTTTFITVVAG